MARKSDKVIRPIFPLKHEFVASLDRVLHEGGMLSDAVRQLLQMPDVIKNGPIRKLLQERVDAFNLARFGDENVDEDDDC